MGEEFRNWSGSVRFTPRAIERPEDGAGVAAVVRRAREEGRAVRVVGAGHSSSDILETEDYLVSLERIKGVSSVDRAGRRATIGAGMTVGEVIEGVLEEGLQPHNSGDVDVQTMVGAIGTGTHGTGIKVRNLAALLVGGRMVTAEGEVREFSVEEDPEFLRAMRASLGTLGIITEARLQLEPAIKLHRRELCTSLKACLTHLDKLIAENRNFDFYWYPRRDDVKLRLLNPPGEGTRDLPYAELQWEETEWAGKILPRSRDLKFDEMEYCVPFEAGPACFGAVRKRILEKHRDDIAWRVFYRTVAADDFMLSPCYGRDTVTIAILHNAGLPYWEYFKDIEPIFRDHGGRPHWGKKFTLKAEQLAPLYPEWERFQEIRQEMDPEGVFLSEKMRGLLGVEKPKAQKRAGGSDGRRMRGGGDGKAVTGGAVGRRKWAIAAGEIPKRSTGDEPGMTSRDMASILNTSGHDAEVRITVLYEDRDPVGPYELKVPPRRVRKVRFNDLIEPYPIPLGARYGAIIESDTPIVVQFTRQDTSSDRVSRMGTSAFADGA